MFQEWEAVRGHLMCRISCTALHSLSSTRKRNRNHAAGRPVEPIQAPVILHARARAMRPRRTVGAGACDDNGPRPHDRPSRVENRVAVICPYRRADERRVTRAPNACLLRTTTNNNAISQELIKHAIAVRITPSRWSQ